MADDPKKPSGAWDYSVIPQPAVTRVDPIEWTYGAGAHQPGDPLGPSNVVTPPPPPPAPPAAGSGGRTSSPGGSSTNMGNLPRTGGTVPSPPAPVTGRTVEGSTVKLGDSVMGASAPMIHGPLPRFNGPIVRPVAAPSFGPGLIPGRGTPKRSGGHHPPDYQR